MTALYALPDDKVIADLLPGLRDRYKPATQAHDHIRAHRGLVPAAIDPAGDGRIMWADIGDHPFREWQFMYTMQHLAQAGAIRDSFVTDMTVLEDDAIEAEGIAPTGFIFHISRCGSTLLAKALARSPQNVVINQGGPLQRGFWAYLTRDWQQDIALTEENLRLFRRLILAMTRRRTEDQEKSFVKFISWNVLYLDFVRRAFPDVPCLFLYRDPVEVIASVLRETTAVLLAKGTDQAAFLTGSSAEATGDMSDIRFLAKCYAKYFETVLPPRDGVSLTNYRQVSAKNFQRILGRGLGYTPEEEELARMAAQFQYHSKDDTDGSKFTPDSAEKQAQMSADDRRIIEEECAGYLDKLDRAPHNLFTQSINAGFAASA